MDIKTRMAKAGTTCAVCGRPFPKGAWVRQQRVGFVHDPLCVVDYDPATVPPMQPRSQR